MDDEAPTAEEFETWLRPVAAVAELGYTKGTGVSEILARCSAGLLRATAHTAVRYGQGAGSPIRLVMIKPEWWKKASHLINQFDDFWDTGRFSITLSGRMSFTLEFFDVRFDPQTLANVPSATKQAPTTPKRIDHISHILHASEERSEAAPTFSPTQSITQRGRPQKSFWDDAILAITQTIHVGDFKPERQADVHRALAEWLTNNGHNAGDTAIKERARKIFNLFKD